MLYLLYIILFVFGVVFGSFLNVIGLRYKAEKFLLDKEAIGGRSQCPICKKQLVWYELVPLFSFLALKGKCRHCGHRISLQYPIIEFLSGIIFVAVPLYFMNTYNVSQLAFSGQDIRWFYGLSIIWTLAFLAMLLLSVIDFRQFLIPNELNIFLAFLGVGAMLLKHGSFLGYYSSILEINSRIWVNHISAALIAMVFLGLIIFLSRGKGMGLGDLKLAGALGLLFGWPDILLVVMLAFVIGSFLSIALMALKKKTLHDSVPFGPFLVLSSFIVFLFGFQIVNGYFKLFGL